MSDQIKFNWLEQGTSIPLYTVYAKNEKQALKKLSSYLSKIGKSEIKLVRVICNDETTAVGTTTTDSQD